VSDASGRERRERTQALEIERREQTQNRRNLSVNDLESGTRICRIGQNPDRNSPPMPEPLLSIRGLKTYFHTPQGLVRAVDGVDLDVYRGEILGVVGESGSGKTMTAFSLLGLVPAPPGIIAGSVRFNGEDLLDQLPRYCRVESGPHGVVIHKDTGGWNRHFARRLAKIRGRRISIIFQEPVTSLDPLYPVGKQIGESLLRSGVVGTRAEARKESLQWLRRVAIPAMEVYDAHPHQLSGGMCQRIMLAIALACRPDILIADEPTTALDASIQLQILNLLARLRRELGVTIVLITHDMHVISHYADRVAIFYAGRVVEIGSKTQIMDPVSKGRHPYTEGLLRSIPILQGRQEARELTPIQGETPSSLDLPKGCKFQPRCPEAYERCDEEPPLVEIAPGSWNRCWRQIEP
jgi:peptide/nickel transport system ATP-binding protein